MTTAKLTIITIIILTIDASYKSLFCNLVVVDNNNQQIAYF